MANFVVEAWIWYGFAMSMVILRITARLFHFKSISRLQFEDWFMLWIAVLYTVLTVFLDIVSGTNSNLINPADATVLTQQEIAARTYGSKVILVVEQCMCAVQWGTKACLLILYWRLTENIVQDLFVKGTAVYVAVTYIVMEALYLGYWCRPFSDYWEVPTDNVQCTTALNHLIVNLTFNLTSDIMIMSIPLPLVLRAHLEFKRKILLILPFTLGFFSIICAVLSKHLSFTQPFSGEWVYWYIREASTIMIVSNMPYTWGLIRRVFHVNSFFGGSRRGSRIDDNDFERPWSAGPEGELRDLRALPVLDGRIASSLTGMPDALSRSSSYSQSKKSPFRFSSWKRSPERGMQKLPSIAPSRDGVPLSTNDFHDQQLQWDNFDISGNGNAKTKSDPAGTISGSSCDATSDGRLSLAYATTDTRKSPPRAHGDALDKLYRLGDGDLTMDIERERKRSIVPEHG